MPFQGRKDSISPYDSLSFWSASALFQTNRQHPANWWSLFASPWFLNLSRYANALRFCIVRSYHRSMRKSNTMGMAGTVFSICMYIWSLSRSTARQYSGKKHTDIRRAYWKNALWSPGYFAASCCGALLRSSSSISTSKKLLYDLNNTIA